MKKICKHCGEEFETNNPQKIYCNRQHYRPCPICGKPVAMIDNDFSREPKCCSPECSHKKRRLNFKIKRCVFCGKEFQPTSGVATLCDRTHFQTCEICGKQFEISKDRIHEGITTCSDACRKELTKRRNLKKYGVEYPMQCAEVQKNFHDAMFKKYGVRHALQLKQFVDKQQQTVIKTNMDRYGVPYACLLPQNIDSHPNVVSEINKRIAERLERYYHVDIKLEKQLDTRLFDICIDSNKLLIEIDPTYTHNAIGNHYNVAQTRDYHLEKSKLAMKYGYRCIHIFDWDNVERIFELIKPIDTTIYARNCRLFKINPDIGDEFLNKYHLQGTCRGQLLYLGLVYEDELVQIMTFGKPRYNKKYDVELLRLCTKSNVRVIGGASKLFKFATDYYGLYNIISYCDRSKFTGAVYEAIGMKLAYETPPQEVWSKGTSKITANLLRQRGYDQLFHTNYGKGTSNEQLMLENGWLPVYDCGQLIYEYR